MIDIDRKTSWQYALSCDVRDAMRRNIPETSTDKDIQGAMITVLVWMSRLGYDATGVVATADELRETAIAGYKAMQQVAMLVLDKPENAVQKERIIKMQAEQNRGRG